MIIFRVGDRQKQGSGTPMDKALEQVYNKPAKGPKSQENVLNGENSLHHEFNKTNALSGLKDVGLIMDYIKRVCNPISNELNGERVRNNATGKENVEEFEFSMRSLDQ